jgi:hypothetical protein
MALSTKTNEDFKMTGDWETQSKALQKKFPQLTDADVKFEEAKQEDLLKRIETRLGKKREDVVSILTNLQTEVK